MCYDTVISEEYTIETGAKQCNNGIQDLQYEI